MKSVYVEPRRVGWHGQHVFICNNGDFTTEHASQPNSRCSCQIGTTGQNRNIGEGYVSSNTLPTDVLLEAFANRMGPQTVDITVLRPELQTNASWRKTEQRATSSNRVVASVVKIQQLMDMGHAIAMEND